MCFQNTCVPSLKSVGSKIISLVSFWCKTLFSGSLLHLSLILPLDTNDLHTQEMIHLLSEEEGITTEEEGGQEAVGVTTPLGQADTPLILGSILPT